VLLVPVPSSVQVTVCQSGAVAAGAVQPVTVEVAVVGVQVVVT
jgi:hypothetical protein